MLRKIIATISMFVAAPPLLAQTTPTKQAERQGVTYCKPAFERITNAVIQGEEHMSRTITHGKEPKSRAAVSQIAILDDISPVVAIVGMSRSAADNLTLNSLQCT